MLSFSCFLWQTRPAVVTDDGFLQYNKKKSGNKYVAFVACVRGGG